jgi:hypothetical protein
MSEMDTDGGDGSRWIRMGEMDIVPRTYSHLTTLRPARAVSKPGQTPFPLCLFGLGEVIPTGTKHSHRGC